jgi:hypothetical protein
MSAAGSILDCRFSIWRARESRVIPSLTEQVVFVLAIVNLVFQEFLCCKQ